MDVTTHLIVVLKQPQQPFVLRRQLDLALQPVDRTLSFACNLSLQTRVAIALGLALRSGGKLVAIIFTRRSTRWAFRRQWFAEAQRVSPLARDARENDLEEPERIAPSF